MATGMSLHLGLNAVDPVHYQGWAGELSACEFDANDMAAMAGINGFKTKTLLTKAAKIQPVLDGLAAAAKALKAGDIFMLTYSGHGGQLPDVNGDEGDMMDETWCLFDGELLDDEIHAALAGFVVGVRVLVFSDSCHSGTVTKNNLVVDAVTRESTARYRAMPNEVAQRTYFAHKAAYDARQQNKATQKAKAGSKASVLLISGCQDNQLSADGVFNGLFTGTLKSVWNGGAFKGDYRVFHKKIVERMPPDQTPNMFWAGTADPVFQGQRVFTV